MYVSADPELSGAAIVRIAPASHAHAHSAQVDLHFSFCDSNDPLLAVRLKAKQTTDRCVDAN